MYKDKKTKKVTLRFSPTEYCNLESEAAKHGVRAVSGKQSLLVAKYMREKLLTTGETLIRFEGHDKLTEEYNVLRTTRKMISYFYYLVKQANTDIRNDPILNKKYGDIPYLQQEYLNKIEELCQQTSDSVDEIYKMLVTINKQLLKFEEEFNVHF